MDTGRGALGHGHWRGALGHGHWRGTLGHVHWERGTRIRILGEARDTRTWTLEEGH